MQFDYFDIHSHLDAPDFDSDREEIIKQMEEQNIGTINIAVDFKSSERGVELSRKYKNIFASVGQHPDELSNDSVFNEDLRLLALDEKVLSIGECGLDYFRLPKEEGLALDCEARKAIQKTIFEYHVDLALEVQKPLMLHVRASRGTQDAYLDTLNILEHHSRTSGGKLRGNAHFFAGDLDVLRRFLDIGFTVSFTGVITFTSDYDELVRYVPSSMIMAETDAPLVAPVPYRGKRNSPLYIPEIVKKIAEIRGESVDLVKSTIQANVLKHFLQNSTIAS